MTWLIVEDDEDIRNIVRLMCNAWGHPTLVFPNGEKAWSWLDDVENGTFQDELPEFALLDIRMPGYTGDLVAERIRKTQQLQDIPIVMMTAYALTQKNLEQIMTTSGADKLVMKPLPDMNDLETILHSVLEDKKAGRI